MKKIQFPILITTLMLLIYNLTPLLGFTWAIVFNFFLLMNFMVLWMVYKILKDGVAPDVTFEEKWYEDEVD